MKPLCSLFALLLCALSAGAQGLPSQSLTKGTWEFQPFIGGGTGVGKSFNTHFLIAGARVGRVLTAEHFHNFLRGNFELAADFMPLYAVIQPGGPVYGGSFKPVIFKWNFTSHQRIAPYALIASGIVFSTSNVPPGNTSTVNFASQAALGFHVFTRPRRAWDFEIQLVHHSNASLGHLNPGLNASLLFTLGYNWFK
ncbi:MAG TPA: acyloxyacyl hydrolase [Candidatus Acidoferrales bacterium]|nr:acyloxyacyl hydrolase [Candidatus Acidoferrales bacterium]